MKKSLVVFTLLLLPATALISISSSMAASDSGSARYDPKCKYPGGTWSESARWAYQPDNGEPCLIGTFLPVYNLYGSGRCHTSVSCSNPKWISYIGTKVRTYYNHCSWPLHGQFKPSMWNNNGILQSSGGPGTALICSLTGPATTTASGSSSGTSQVNSEGKLAKDLILFD
jgi:hypothetical protein